MLTTPRCRRVGRRAHDREHRACGQVVAEAVVGTVDLPGCRGDRAGGGAGRDAEHREHVGDPGADGHDEVVPPFVGDERELVRRCRHGSSPQVRVEPPPAVSDRNNSHGYGGPDRCEGHGEGAR